jgi:16S rRNA C967 or C1407 C5-methylase (RsmB/RsmF family)
MTEPRRVFDELLELLTESADPAFRDLDMRSTVEVLEMMNREDAKVAAAVGAEIPHIARAVELVVDALVGGGRLVYATCSILPCENAEVVRGAVEREGFLVRSAADVLSSQGISADDIVTEEGYLRVDPRSGVGDGFFAAILTRR